MSSSSTLSSNFLIQFRTFCCNVEQDSQKLRKLMEKPALGAGSSSIIGVEEENYVNSLKNQVIGLNDQFERIESQLCGPIETRLSQVSVGEILDKFSCLQGANEAMLHSLELYVSKFGVGQNQKQGPSSSSGALGEGNVTTKSKVAFASNDENEENDENQENVCNRSVAFADQQQQQHQHQQQLQPNSRVSQKIKMHQSSGKERQLLGEISLEDVGNEDAINGTTADDDHCDISFDYQDTCDQVQGDGVMEGGGVFEGVAGGGGGESDRVINDPDYGINVGEEEDDDNNGPTHSHSFMQSTNVTMTPAPATQSDDATSTLSPLMTPGTGNADINSKTPTLADWKLSEATRNLVMMNDPGARRRSLVTGGGVGGVDIDTTTFTLANSPLSTNEESPLATISPTVTTTMMATTGKKASRMSYGYTGLASVSHGLYDDMETVTQTPQSTLRPRQMLLSAPRTTAHDNAFCDTPTTPTIGTPFQTCDLQTNIVGGGAAGLPATLATTSAVVAAAVGSISPKTLELADELTSSPPPASSNTPVEASFIPTLTGEEWEKAPSFLRMQVTIDLINAAIGALNVAIANNCVSVASKISFSQDEIEGFIGTALPSDKIRAVILGLVHLKRMDLGSEKGVKVFIIKK